MTSRPKNSRRASVRAKVVPKVVPASSAEVKRAFRASWTKNKAAYKKLKNL